MIQEKSIIDSFDLHCNIPTLVKAKFEQCSYFNYCYASELLATSFHFMFPLGMVGTANGQDCYTKTTIIDRSLWDTNINKSVLVTIKKTLLNILE